MSDLQTSDTSATDGIINQDIAQVEPGTVENGPDLDTGEGGDPDKINQDRVNDRINKATHLRHKAERATLAEKKRADDLQARLDAIDDSKPAPTISALPDQYDVSEDEYKAAVAKRDNEIRAEALYNSKEEARGNATVLKNNEATAERNRKLAKSSDDYQKRAVELKVTVEQAQTAADIIGEYGMSNDLGKFILDDPKGPLIVQYLSKNLTELSELTQMSPMDAAVKISQTISPKFASIKPVNSNAPAPLNAIKGSGAAPKKRGATGTKFE